MSDLSELKDFIEYAEKNRKYASETARGKRIALKLFEDELNDDETKSLNLFDQRFDKIYGIVYQKHKKDITASSLKVYKSRVRGLLNDFKKYAADPTTFDAWDPTRKREGGSAEKSSDKKGKRTPSKLIEAEVVGSRDAEVRFSDEDYNTDIIPATLFSQEINRIEVHLRPGFKVSLSLPSDLTTKEANRLKHMIDGMVAHDETT